MSSLIVEKHASLLSRGDVIQLFRRLEETAGNTSKAARMCGLERKTVYGWKEAGEIRLRTKKKILAALIENLTEETLDFIVQRSAEASADVLRIYLSALYEKALGENTASPEFLRLTSKFDQIKQKFSGLVADSLELEVEDMLRNILERAHELGVFFEPSPNNLVRLEEFSVLIPSLMRTISAASPYTPHSEIAKTFNIPENLVHSFSTALYENYTAMKAMATSEMVRYPVTEIQLAATISRARKSTEPLVWVEEEPSPEMGLPVPGGTI